MSNRRQLFLFLAAVVCMSVGVGVHDSIFNNFLSDTFNPQANVRGWLEFPREMPGFLVVAMTGVLCTLAVTRLAAVSTALFAAGMLGMALFGKSFWPMIGMMIVGSAGLHLSMPATASLALDLSHENRRGRRMGQVGSVGTAGYVIGTSLVWLAFDKTAPQYRAGFLCAMAMGLLACVIYGAMHVRHLPQPRSRLVFRKKYSLYYVLEFFSGARKQIFITFGPWVLIRVYHQPATDMAGLLMTAALIGIVFKPLAGHAMDRFGEGRIMIVDGVVLSAVCVGYGYAGFLTATPEHARRLACACYVLDNLLFALGDARVLYLSRLTNSREETTSTLAMGVSINHVASMTIPVVAGVVWMRFGYEGVFLAGAVLALGLAAIATRVPARRPGGQAPAAGGEVAGVVAGPGTGATGEVIFPSGK